ncbi:helix-turn-helix protein [Herbihabitans rhizosphaerae]|uniref:Helix-turn-helix protein n=1 Tax=Herbihabitans rhizosphaerae TaxID=1872711 RepID=A0A4Q7L142_9PSEU|nr:helix-turn-helix transcriptional regulator [Herbihabitans rhizosphaerae]RZS43199.1 helix-turn-helix protein [Herbihabitans rhizosphaerae]
MGARQTVERRQLGLSLKRHRVARGRSQADVGKLIGQSDSRISKVEDGSATLSPAQLERVLDYLDVRGGERDTLLELGARARRRQRRSAKESHEYRAYADTLPGSFQRLADMEAEAAAICCYGAGVVPGLLQSPSYIRAVTSACDGVFWPTSEIEVENRFAFRRERQIKVLEAQTSKKLEFVVAEEALDVDDDTTVMREQLEHLLYLVKQHQRITIQVLKRGMSLRNPVANGGIVVLDFAGSAPRVAFASTAYGPSTYHDDEEDTAAMLRAFRKVQRLARDPADTATLIRRKLQENSS